MPTDYSNFIENLDIGAQRTPFSSGLLTCEAVAKELGISEAQVAKSMVARWADGRFIIAVLPGDQRLNMKKLRAIVNAIKKDLRLAEEKEILQDLNMTVGAVTPLIKIDQSEVQIVMDSTLFLYKTVNISSGNPEVGINIDPARLQELLTPLVGDLGRD